MKVQTDEHTWANISVPSSSMLGLNREHRGSDLVLVIKSGTYEKTGFNYRAQNLGEEGVQRNKEATTRREVEGFPD